MSLVLLAACAIRLACFSSASARRSQTTLAAAFRSGLILAGRQLIELHQYEDVFTVSGRHRPSLFICCRRGLRARIRVRSSLEVGRSDGSRSQHASMIFLIPCGVFDVKSGRVPFRSALKWLKRTWHGIRREISEERIRVKICIAGSVPGESLVARNTTYFGGL